MEISLTLILVNPRYFTKGSRWVILKTRLRLIFYHNDSPFSNKDVFACQHYMWWPTKNDLVLVDTNKGGLGFKMGGRGKISIRFLSLPSIPLYSTHLPSCTSWPLYFLHIRFVYSILSIPLCSTHLPQGPNRF